MVLAAGLGTRLRPLTYDMPKPMVPVLDRPIMAHVIDLCRRQGFDEIVANLHWFPDAIRGYFGDSIEYRFEDELLGTAGGVRNARDFFGDEPIVVLSGDSLTDFDLNALLEHHRRTGGVATIAVKRVDDPSGLGVVLHGSDGRVSGFQEKPHPDEALSNLANCCIYCFSADVFDYFPASGFADWANDVFPALLEHDVPFHVHEIDAYWSDVGSLAELRRATFDAVAGRVRLDVRASNQAPADCRIEGDVWIGDDVTIGAGVRLIGPVAIGDGASIGHGVALRETVVFPGASLAPGQVVAGAICAQR